ncbi:MAG: hypothetical protein U1F43_32910 [Myxococcota bacterium]
MAAGVGAPGHEAGGARALRPGGAGQRREIEQAVLGLDLEGHDVAEQAALLQAPRLLLADSELAHDARRADGRRDDLAVRVLERGAGARAVVLATATCWMRRSFTSC